jgi:hypothetical protein
MAIVQRNTKVLHRKEWQMMTPAPVFAAIGSFMVAPQSGYFDVCLFVQTATLHYLYHHDEDSWVQIPSGALAGSFGAGACGEYHPWSATYTASGGSTTTVTVAAATHNLSYGNVGTVIEFVSSGTNSGLRRTITAIDTSSGGAGTITLTLDSAVTTAVLSSHTFRLTTGRFFVLNAGTIAAGSFRIFDVATLSWSSPTTTGLPASIGTDGRLVCAYNYNEAQATGTATAGAATTLTNSAKTWTTNQWTNYQVRITAGTGLGQTRTIASNTGTVLTVSAAWTTNPDATSKYEIEANEDWIYYLGNGSVTMYRYSISANTWTTLAPTTARAGAPSLGMGAVVIGKSGETTWANESVILDGRYIYSPRGGNVSTIDRFDIAGGTAGAGAWQAITYVGTETFSTGSSYFAMGRYIYMRKDGTNRFFKYSIRSNYVEPFTTDLFPDGSPTVGQKIWVKNLDTTNTVQWVYSLANNGTALRRVMII